VLVGVLVGVWVLVGVLVGVGVGVLVIPIGGKSPLSVISNPSLNAHENEESTNHIVFIWLGSNKTWFSKMLSSHFL
jgi:hypothetical protein